MTRPALFPAAGSRGMPYIILTANGQELQRANLTGPTIIGRSPECQVSVRDILLSRRLTLRESTKKLACMLGGSGLASSETRLSSTLMPSGDLSAHCSRETSGAQVTNKGDSRHATLHP